MGDSKNRKVPQKQKASSNSKRKSSSDHKEHAPKREKTIKPDPDDGIAMSKQLLLKKSNARTQRRTTSKPERICPNGKPIPSLSELEKMFEDSDDDDDQTPIQKPKRTPSTPEKRTPTNIIEKDLILPTTIDKITERLLGSIQNQNLPSPDELLEAAALLRNKSPPPTPIIPPKKRKVPEVPYIVGCKDRPQVIHKPSTNFCKGDDDYGVEASAQDPEEEIPTKRAKKSRIPKFTKSIFNAQSDEIAERLIKDDVGNLSDASTDSNKTIEYDPTPIQHPRALSFSPLPSTSKDKKTFEKNDELFNESLKETNLSKDSTLKNADDDINDKLIAEIMEDDITPAKQSTPIKKDDALIKEESTLEIKDKLIKEKSTLNINEDDVQIIEIPYDTIEIVDICNKTVGIQSTASRAVSTNDIEIIEPTGSEFVKPKENNNIGDKIHDDDECMIITSSGTNNNDNNANVSESTIVIDDEYSTINMEFESFNDEPIEIIDVDDIIAENNTILHKWKNNQDKELNNINTVIDVPNTYKNVSTPQTTVTPSTEVQTTSPPTTASTTLQAEVTPSTTLQAEVTPSTTLQAEVTPSTTLQAEVTPSTTLQAEVTPSTTLQAEVTPSTTIPTPSTSTPNYDTNMTNRNSATNTYSNYSRQRRARFHSILDDFFQSVRETPPYVTSIYDSGTRITELLTTMINRLQSPDTSIIQTSRPTSNQTSRPTSIQTSRPTNNQTSRSTSNQTSRPTSNQTSRPTSNQTPRPTSNPTPRPTSNQTPRPASNTNRTHLHPVNTAMADTTSVLQNSICTLQNADSSQRDLGLNNPSSNSETQQTSMTPSPIPSRNIGDCPICLDPLNTSNGIASTICGHVFCLSCIQASVRTNGKKCPTCRKALKGAGGGFHLLYL